MVKRVRNVGEAVATIAEWLESRGYENARFLLTPVSKQDWGFVAHTGLIDARMDRHQIGQALASGFEDKLADGWDLQVS